MKHNTRLYVRHCQVKCRDMSHRVNEFYIKTENLQKIIDENDERDRVRVLMSSETGEETALYLISKYITNPKHDPNKEDDEDMEGYLLRKSEALVEGINQFISKHMEEAAKLKIES